MKSEVGAKKMNKVSKIVGIVSTVFLVLCVGILLYTTISYSKTGLVKFFGYSYHVIQSPSMEPDIKVGDLVIVKKVSFDQIEVGNDILFKCEDTTSAVYGKYVVHRVVEIIDGDNGVYKTQGVNNPGPDKVYSKAEGKVVSVNSSLGGLFKFLTQGRNIIFVIGIFGVVIFSVMQLCSVVANTAKLKAEKDKEKLDEDQELKERIKKEVEEEILKNDKKDGENAKKLAKNEQKEENFVQNIEKQDEIELEKSSSKNDDNAETGGDDK